LGECAIEQLAKLQKKPWKVGSCLCLMFPIKGKQISETETDNAPDIEGALLWLYSTPDGCTSQRTYNSALGDLA
jgi:hypothetical protein